MDGQSVTYRIEISDSAQKTIVKWKKSNPAAFKKLRQLIPELESHPRTGTGHPEALIGGKDVTYSRRIGKFARMIYDIHDDVVTVTILKLEGHYDDK